MVRYNQDTVPAHLWLQIVLRKLPLDCVLEFPDAPLHSAVLDLDPVEFARACGIEPDPWQADLLCSTSRNSFVSMTWCPSQMASFRSAD